MKMLLRLAVPAAAIVLAGPLAAQNYRYLDLTHAFGENTVYWPTAEKFTKSTVAEGVTEQGYYYSAYALATAEHGGTHLDAPSHFHEEGDSTDEVPLDRLVGAGVRIDVSGAVGNDADYLITVDDIRAWEADFGAIEPGTIVLLYTGWSRHWPDAEAYLGTAERGAEAVADLHFPGLDPRAAQFLVSERKIAAVGIDTASIDYGQSATYEAHRILAADGAPIFENVANLSGLDDTGFAITALPMKIEGGSGGPLRIIAILPETLPPPR